MCFRSDKKTCEEKYTIRNDNDNDNAVIRLRTPMPKEMRGSGVEPCERSTRARAASDMSWPTRRTRDPRNKLRAARVATTLSYPVRHMDGEAAANGEEEIMNV